MQTIAKIIVKARFFEYLKAAFRNLLSAINYYEDCRFSPLGEKMLVYIPIQFHSYVFFAFVLVFLIGFLFGVPSLKGPLFFIASIHISAVVFMSFGLAAVYRYLVLSEWCLLLALFIAGISLFRRIMSQFQKIQEFMRKHSRVYSFLLLLNIPLFSVLLVVLLSSPTYKHTLQNLSHLKENCWMQTIPPPPWIFRCFYEIQGDVNPSPRRSLFRVTENDNLLPLPHSLHAKINEQGNGRYSHWVANTVYLSASDNSDPTKNGRVYAISGNLSPRFLMKLSFFVSLLFFYFFIFFKFVSIREDDTAFEICFAA